MNFYKANLIKSFTFNKIHKNNITITKHHAKLHIVYDPFDFTKRRFCSFYTAISWLKQYGDRHRFYQLDNILFVKVINNKVYKYDFIDGILNCIY